MEKIVILTGAGISAQSGPGTFRDTGGIWSRYKIEDVATPQGFARDPGLVQGFYNERRATAACAKPNPAHLAQARLQLNWPGDVAIITQNVDAQHKAGSALTVELNPEPPAPTSLFAQARTGPASQIVPQWVDDLLQQAR